MNDASILDNTIDKLLDSVVSSKRKNTFGEILNDYVK